MLRHLFLLLSVVVLLPPHWTNGHKQFRKGKLPEVPAKQKEIEKLAKISTPLELWSMAGILGDNLTHLNTFGEKVFQKKTFFSIVVTTYNVEDLVKKSIDSICNQTYPYFRLIIFDDASSDKTVDAIRNALHVHRRCKDRSIMLTVDQRRGQAFGRQAAAQFVHDAEVVVFVDGDDYLYDNNALGKLKEVFSNRENWPINTTSGEKVKPLMTYGNFVRLSGGKVAKKAYNVQHFPRHIVEQNAYRQHPWISHHPRVSTGWLVKSVPHSAVMDWNCDWLKMNSDVAQSMFMLERTHGAHVRTNVTLYVYNQDHSKATPNSYYRSDIRETHNRIQDWARGKYKAPNGQTILDQIKIDTCRDAANKDMVSLKVLW